MASIDISAIDLNPNSDDDDDEEIVLPEPDFSKPASLSTNFLTHKLNSLQNASFNPTQALSKLKASDKKTSRKVYEDVTSGALNIPRSTSEYKNLVKLDTTLLPKPKPATATSATIENQDPQLAVNAEVLSRITKPRAKKSVRKEWLESRSLKPNLERFRSSNFEVDTISLPFPQLSYNPFVTVSNMHKGEEDGVYGMFAGEEGVGTVIHPVLSMGSFEINMEDTKRLFFYERPVKIADFQ
ncbi:hypothetical protein HDV05_007636 [Chytridiales sp. JEL 0842]|nr:hypothetical protein HDV05_007636 [Chytridiales sp. JEL 0842]